MNKKFNSVTRPAHYANKKIQVIDYMEDTVSLEEFKGHLRLTAIKYLSRAGKKSNELEDFKKGRWYLDRLISTLEKQKGAK